jgi:hypothetical protein
VFRERAFFVYAQWGAMHMRSKKVTSDRRLWGKRFVDLADARQAIPAIKRTYMKRKQIAAMCTIGFAVSFASIDSAQSTGILGMQTDPNRIQTANEASKLSVGTTLTFKCARCGASQSMVVDERKAILSWFDSLKSKRCPGPCGGWVHYVSRGTPAGPNYPDTFNTCSRCRRPTISWTLTKSKQT